MRTLKHRCEPSAARDGLLRFAQPMATLRSPSPQRPSGSTIWIFWEHSDEMTGNILARQWHPRLGTSTDEAIRLLIKIVALQSDTDRIPLPRHQSLATHATAAEPERLDDLGADQAVGRRLAPETANPPSLGRSCFAVRHPRWEKLWGGRRRSWHLHRPYEPMEVAPWPKSMISAEA